MLEYQKTLLESKKFGGNQPGENKNDDPRQQQEADDALKAKVNPDSKRIMPDSSDQTQNSPIQS